jgi:phosphoribosylamine--glycine ligase
MGPPHRAGRGDGRARLPGTPRKGDAIDGLPADADDLKVFHAGTALTDGHLRTSGGRVLCVTALGDSVRVAQQRAYEGVRAITIRRRRLAPRQPR